MSENENIIERDALESYQDDMVKYLIIVNRRRAIPDVIDGLKPVQRKILYDMFYKGVISFAHRTKSQAIVGSTMELFYGHGDCVRGTTKLFGLDYSTVDIEYLFKTGVQEFQTLAVDPNTGKIVPAIAHSFRIGQFTNKIYHIALSNGYDFQCTSNHPILTANDGFVKAEDLKIGTRLYSKFLHTVSSKTRKGTKNIRPAIGSFLIQNIISDNLYKKLPGYIIHHEDENPFNNMPYNLRYITRSEHQKIHYGMDGEYNEGLVKGREAMFSPDGEFYEKTKEKNSQLSSILSEYRHIIQFQYMVGKMREQGIPVTEENYNANKVGLYHAAKFDKIQKIYGLDFYQMVEYSDKHPFSVADEYRRRNPVPAFTFKEKLMSNQETLILDRQLNAIDKMIDMGNVTYQNFLNLCVDIDKTDEQTFCQLLQTHSIKRPYIVNITVEDVNNEPMYDFTVDGYENVIIPTAGSYLPVNENDLGVAMISIHNSSLYGAMEPMTNYYKCKVPLLRGKGNWGDLMGNDPAASRYTETSLSDFAYDCIFGDLKESKTVVDWMDNYQRTAMEPEYLPIKVPLLLINSSSGIGVGINTNIPTHNLAEVCQVTRQLLHDPQAKFLLYPDHCQPCKVIGEKKDFEDINRRGFGKYKVRGMVEVGEEKGYPIVYIKSLPDNVSSTAIVDKLNTMYANKELPMIKNIADATGQTVDIRITLNKGADPGYMKQILYTKTQVQASMSVNFEAVQGTDLHRFNYREYLLNFIENRKMVKFRLYCYKLKQATTRHHLLDAYIKVIESGQIDNIVAMIKKQKTIDETALQEFLIKKVNITDIQARYILDTDIRRLSLGYLNKYKAEYKELTEKMKFYEQAITDGNKIIIAEIDQELQDIAKKYGTPRICPVIKESDDSNIPKGVFKVVVTKRNYLRKIVDTDKVGVVKGDDPKFIVRADNTENILLFDNMGKVFKMPVSKIPLVANNGAGTDIRVLNRSMTADIIAVYYEPTIQKIIDTGRKHYLVVATKNNAIKKLDMEDFLNVSTSGLRYSIVKDSDEVTGVVIAPADLDILIYSRQKALRTSVKNIPLMKRSAVGSKAMTTNDDIEGISVLYPDADLVTVVTDKGKINKFEIKALAPHGRGCAGINVIKLKDGDSIKAIYGACDHDILRIITANNGTIEVPVESITLRSPVAIGDNISVRGDKIIRVDLMWQPKK